MLTSISESFFLFLPSAGSIDVNYHARKSFYPTIYIKMMFNYFVMLNIMCLKMFWFSKFLHSLFLKYIIVPGIDLLLFINYCLLLFPLRTYANENSFPFKYSLWNYSNRIFLKINSNYSYSSLPSKPLSLLSCLSIPFFCILVFHFSFLIHSNFQPADVPMDFSCLFIVL